MMKRSRTLWMSCALCLFLGMTLCFALDTRAQSPGQSDPIFIAADARFDNALTNSNPSALAALLDANFTWTDVNGKSETATEVAHVPPKPIFGGNNLTRVEHAIYGDVGVTQLHNGRWHALRIWVKRPAGWRALVYHEVQLRDAPPPGGAPPATGAECINPCRSLPFEPKSASQRAVATSFSALETSVIAHDAQRWASMIGDEFEALSSNADKLLDKKTRMTELAQASMAGLVPVPLVNARMTEFGDAIVMESQHQPVGAKPMHATRLWVRRKGVWMEVISYQTTIQAAPVAPR
jgi:hypothetical protein